MFYLSVIRVYKVGVSTTRGFYHWDSVLSGTCSFFHKAFTNGTWDVPKKRSWVLKEGAKAVDLVTTFARMVAFQRGRVCTLAFFQQVVVIGKSEAIAEDHPSFKLHVWTEGVLLFVPVIRRSCLLSNDCE
ncbi:hypothetical protein TNCT_72701 [Trichonephila clavata]|uniref:Uncharacterized protein n=1 Tax=Trichonephila clavata TaxID=2740835 RepID=A0A8X6LH93_TRICU|nr:hypothetical protein TNCT_72701 [Trichonephila clavata]